MMIMGVQVYVSGCFDDLQLPDLLFLQAAALRGRVHAFLWPDALCRQVMGTAPLFPAQERLYLLRALRYVDSAECPMEWDDPHRLPLAGPAEGVLWLVDSGSDSGSGAGDPGCAQKRAFAQQHGMRLEQAPSGGIPAVQYDPLLPNTGRKKVLVTGSFDWLHSGHVRFFEVCAGYGDLYVIVGHDANIRLLKGEGHPMFPQQQRLFMVQAVRHVTRAFISTGHGWMDAAPEIDLIRPDFYVVNEDGDVEEKRAFCREKGIEYMVLKRQPRPGLPGRRSTWLRRRRNSNTS